MHHSRTCSVVMQYNGCAGRARCQLHFGSSSRQKEKDAARLAHRTRSLARAIAVSLRVTSSSIACSWDYGIAFLVTLVHGVLTP